MSRPKRKLKESIDMIADTGGKMIAVRQADFDIKDSTASFRIRCEEHSATLPEINLDLSEDELEELAPAVKASWLRLQAILEPA